MIERSTCASANVHDGRETHIFVVHRPRRCVDQRLYNTKNVEPSPSRTPNTETGSDLSSRNMDQRREKKKANLWGTQLSADSFPGIQTRCHLHTPYRDSYCVLPKFAHLPRPRQRVNFKEPPPAKLPQCTGDWRRLGDFFSKPAQAHTSPVSWGAWGAW